MRDLRRMLKTAPVVVAMDLATLVPPTSSSRARRRRAQQRDDVAISIFIFGWRTPRGCPTSIIFRGSGRSCPSSTGCDLPVICCLIVGSSATGEPELRVGKTRRNGGNELMRQLLDICHAQGRGRFLRKTNPIFGFVRNRSGERHSYATQVYMTFGAGENWVRFIIFRGSHSCCLSSLPSGPVLVDRTREAVSGRKCRMRVSIYKGGQLRSTAKLW